MSKPSWDDAPEYASFLAQDMSGKWAWYEKEPEIDFRSRSWIQGEVIGMWEYADPQAVDWMISLESRP